MNSGIATTLAAAAIPGTQAGEECFHCGLPVPRGSHHSVAIDGVARALCCTGCQAVAQTIVDHGLTSYYHHRTSLPQRREAVPRILNELQRFDLPQVQKNFVASDGAHACEAALLLEGVVCAACVWLIERHISRLPGVLAVQINYATQRAQVRWDDQRLRVSDILAAVAAIGYRAWPYDIARSQETRQREQKTLLLRLLIAGLGMMQVMMYAVPAYVTTGELTPDIGQLLRVASFVLTLPVVFYSAIPFFAGAWRNLKARQVGMDVPVALGIGAAFAASTAATLGGSGEVYFDSISMFVFLLLGVRFLELSARGKAVAAHERLARLAPAVAERLTGDLATAVAEPVAVAALEPGDHVRVRPGMVIPADGKVVMGASEISEAMLTGEAQPIAKHPGDCVTAGTLNLTGPLVMRVERVGTQTVLAAILRLLDRAGAEKPGIAQLADRIARWFVAALLAIAAVVAVAWYVIDPSRALGVTVAVLVASCPCALSLATPAAITAATGALHAAGVLVTRGHALETLAAATDFVFDKTGTLTQGAMRLVGVIPLTDLTADECLALAAQIESASEHPIGRALAAAAPRSCAVHAISSIINQPGAGIEAVADGATYRLGNGEFVAALNRLAPPEELLRAGDDVTVIALGDAQRWIALFTLADPLREHARSVVCALQRSGKRVHVVSGDRPQVVGHVAHALGIEAACAGVTPAGKLEYVQSLQRQGKVVAMVGDGVNDAAALAAAQVSAAMGSGADVAHGSADMVLLSGQLGALLAAVRTADATLRVIRQNLWWAFVYNIVMVPLAAFGCVTPLAAGAGMALSSLLVVLNALRLVRRVDELPAADRVPVPAAS